jgi:hypothetical protein
MEQGAKNGKKKFFKTFLLPVAFFFHGNGWGVRFMSVFSSFVSKGIHLFVERFSF